MTRFRSERGQAVVLPILFMAVLLGMAALVLDVGSWYQADRAAQATADAAALAGAQELPGDSTGAEARALEYVDKNGGSAEEAEVSFPAADTITVVIERTSPGFFANVLGIDSVEVAARASARAASPAEAKWVAPIVVNEKHPKLQCTPEPCFGEPTELEYHHLKEKGPSEPDGAGSFGFINLVIESDNPGTSELGKWIREGYDQYMALGDYDARTGNPFGSTHVDGSLEDRIGDELLFPIYRKLTGTGSNAKYEIVGWVGFRLTGTDLKGNKEKLFGYFTQVIWEGIQSSSGSNSPGVTSIALVE
jgi:hypothetical protein